MRTAACSVLICAALAIVGGCGDTDDSDPGGAEESGAVEVVLSAESVAIGDSLQASLRNGTDEEIVYGAGYSLEREQDGEFVAVELPREPIPDIGLIAKPGETGPPVTVRIPADLTPGTYRVSLSELADGSIPQAEFQVTG